jgi:hypothetical protein
MTQKTGDEVEKVEVRTRSSRAGDAPKTQILAYSFTGHDTALLEDTSDEGSVGVGCPARKDVGTEEARDALDRYVILPHQLRPILSTIILTFKQMVLPASRPPFCS